MLGMEEGRKEQLEEESRASRAAASTSRIRAADAPTATPEVFINLTNVTDLLIDGQGARLTFTTFLTFVACTDCVRVVVTNFTFDFAPLPYTALRIVARQSDPAISRIPAGDSEGAKSGAAGNLSVRARMKSGNMAANTTLEVELLPGHPTLESNPAFAAVFIAEVMDATERRIKRGGSLTVPFVGWQRVNSTTSISSTSSLRSSPRPASPITLPLLPDMSATKQMLRPLAEESSPRYMITLAGPVLASDADVGDIFVLDPRIVEGFTIIGGREVVLAGLAVQACANECFTSSGSEALAIVGCGTHLVPGRYLAANNGGHNHHSARVGVWVEGGLWENAGDDTLHVSGVAMTVVRQVQYDPDVLLSLPWTLHVLLDCDNHRLQPQPVFPWVH